MTTTDAATLDPAVEAWLDAHADERLESYREFLSDPEHLGACRSTPPTAGGRPSGSPRTCGAIGIEHVEVGETGGHPIVYGDWLHAPGAPTALVYCHYDVQPVDPLDLWETPPFEPVVAAAGSSARGVGRRQGPAP